MNKESIFYFIIVFPFLFSCESKETRQEETIVEDSVPQDQAVSPGENRKTILFFGNSLTAGYGVEPGEAFPALIQKKIDSLGLNYHVVNAGLSGETTSSGEGRVDWVLKQEVDIFILELGGNDGLRGIPTEETQRNLQDIIDKVEATYPDAKIILAGMQVPPNMGSEYATDFRQVFVDIADKNDIPLIPFLLEGVGGEVSLNVQDGIHPNVEGHKIVADNVWELLQEELE